MSPDKGGPVAAHPSVVDAAVLRERGAAALRDKRFDEAIRILSEALILEPKHGQAQLHLGAALQGVGRHAEAARALVASQRAMPDDPEPYLYAAVSLLAIGQARAALIAASEACHRAPRAAAAHYAYGQAFLALGEPARAEQAFGAAVKLAPRWPDAYVNFGLARYRQGAIEDAKQAMRLALQAEPAHQAAAANLAAFMRISGEIEAAERLMRERLRATPGSTGMRLNLAADLLQEERAEEALALLEETQTPKGEAERRHWRLQQALALLQLRQPEEARQALASFEAIGRVPPALAPLLLWRRTLLALAENDLQRASESAALMEEALARMGPDAVPEHAIMARFDLAKFWSSRGDGARAFVNWTAGHKALSRLQPFSRAVHRAFVDASIEAFSARRLRDGERARNRDPAPVFIVGMPRSGTTLVEQILAAHRDVFAAGERAALGRTFARLGGTGNDAAAARAIAGLTSGALDEAAGAYLADLHALAPNARRVVDKMPGNFLYLGLAALMLPGAKFIECARDPRDIGLSIFTFRFHGQHDYAHDLGDLGWYIGEQQRLMAHWRAALPGSILTVRLSDWVEDFDGTLSRVLDHLELPPDPACGRFHEQKSRVRTVSRAQVREPVNARGLGRWRGYARELEPLIAELEAAGALAGWSEARHELPPDLGSPG